MARRPKQQVVPASEVRENFATLVQQVALDGGHVVIERHGRQVAALVSMEDLALLVKARERGATTRRRAGA